MKLAIYLLMSWLLYTLVRNMLWDHRECRRLGVPFRFWPHIFLLLCWQVLCGFFVYAFMETPWTQS